MAGSLDGLTVIDLTQGIAGPVTGMVLAEQGADVVKVEPPGGDPYRDILAGYLVWNRSKRSATLDLESVSGREALAALLSRADVLVESYDPGVTARLGMDHSALNSRHPHLVHCSISGYGYDHPMKDRPGIDALVMAAMGVPYEQLGHRDGPIFHYFPLASYGAAFAALLGITSALRARLHTGRGQWVETSLHDGVALLTSLLWQWMEDPPPAFAHRMGNPMPYRPWQYECSDGLWFHRMSTARGNLGVILRLLGYEMPAAVSPASMSNEERQKIEQMEIDGFRKRPRQEWIELLRAHDVPVEPVQSTEEALRREQAWVNGAAAEVQHPEYGKMVQAGLGFRMSETPGAIKPFFPSTGGNTQQVLDPPSLRAPLVLARAQRPKDLRYPLDGIRVIDFGHYLAGPFGTMLLADLGADVIKVEPVEGERMRMPSQPFMACQRGKRDIAADLKKAEGLEIAQALVEGADMVHHNHRPGVAERLKIDYESLKKVKPDLVYVHSPAYGVHGPDSQMGGYDQLFQANSGLEYMGGGEGNPPIWYKAGAVDHGGALLSAIGGIMALYHRDRTGQGQFVDSSLLNAGLFYNSDAFLCDDRRPSRRPTLDRTQTGINAAYRLYECRDEWVCVAALFQKEWTALSNAVGRPELANDSRYSTHQARTDRRDELAQIMEPIFLGKTAREWADILDGAGVPAQVCNKGFWLEFLRDPSMIESGRVASYYQMDLGGEMRQFGKTIRFSETPQVIQGPPPGLGEHTRQILAELGFSSQRQEELRAAGVVTWPASS